MVDKTISHYKILQKLGFYQSLASSSFGEYLDFKKSITKQAKGIMGHEMP